MNQELADLFQDKHFCYVLGLKNYLFNKGNVSIRCGKIKEEVV